jgi:hypothetical protein
VLSLVVGGAAAIDAIADHCRPPWIEIVAPFADHAVDDIAMSVHQDGRRRGALAIVRQEIGVLAGWRFDQFRRETQSSKSRGKFLHKIGPQRVAAPGILAFRGIGNPALEFAEKFTGMKRLARPFDRIGSGHVFLFSPSRGF